jgi:UDP-N-acetylglucosamine 3-dehydrogenase
VIRLAVIGAGVMGANHVRVAAANPFGELAFVVDPDLARAEALTARYGGMAVSTIDQALDDIDAVIVAAPSPLHLSLGKEILLARKHVLMEKPLALNAEDGRQLVALAERVGRVLMVGHVERFNSVVDQLPALMDEPYHVEAFRVGPYSDRISHSVVLDLMIHDIDIVLFLIDSPVVSVAAVGQMRKSRSVDLVVASLVFGNGVTATLTASRISQHKTRKIRITQRDSVLTGDLLRQQIELSRVDHIEYSASDGRRYRQTGTIEIPSVQNLGEPLELEQREFVSAIKEDRSPKVDGRMGLAALELADRIMDCLEMGSFTTA